MTPSRGYAVELAGVVIIALASTYGMPVSTTQIIVSVLPPLRTAHIKRFMRSHLHAFTCKQCKEIWKQAGVLVSKSLCSHLSVMVILCPTCKAYVKGWPEPYNGPYIHLVCMVLVNPKNLATVPCAPVAWQWDGIDLLYQVSLSDVGQCSFLLKLSYKSCNSTLCPCSLAVRRYWSLVPRYFSKRRWTMQFPAQTLLQRLPQRLKILGWWW